MIRNQCCKRRRVLPSKGSGVGILRAVRREGVMLHAMDVLKEEGAVSLGDHPVSQHDLFAALTPAHWRAIHAHCSGTRTATLCSLRLCEDARGFLAIACVLRVQMQVLADPQQRATWVRTILLPVRDDAWP